MPGRYPTPESIRDAYEFDARLEQMRRTQHFLVAAVVLLAAGLTGFGWYAYPILKTKNAVLTEVPQILTNIQKDVFTLGEQARATSAKLDDWSVRQEDLRAQLNKARGELIGRIADADHPTPKSVPKHGGPLPDKSGVRRIEFELSKNHGRQVAPGITVELTATDARNQRVTGSVLLTLERRAIPMRQQRAQQPIFLSSFSDGRTRELVITRVTNTGAAGYLLVPAEADSATSRGPGE